MATVTQAQLNADPNVQAIIAKYGSPGNGSVFTMVGPMQQELQQYLGQQGLTLPDHQFINYAGQLQESSGDWAESVIPAIGIGALTYGAGSALAGGAPMASAGGGGIGGAVTKGATGILGALAKAGTGGGGDGGTPQPSVAGQVGQTAGAIEAARAKALMDAATIQQRQDQLGLNRYNDQLAGNKYNLSVPGALATQAGRGDILANAQDMTISGLPPGIHVPNISGGLRPSNFSAASRQLGAAMTRNALADELSGKDLIGAPPPLTPLPTSNGLDRALQGTALGGGLLNALSGLWRPGGGTTASRQTTPNAGGLPTGTTPHPMPTDGSSDSGANGGGDTSGGGGSDSGTNAIPEEPPITSTDLLSPQVQSGYTIQLPDGSVIDENGDVIKEPQ